MSRVERRPLPTVRIGRHCCSESTNLDNYRPVVGEALVDEIQMLSQRLKDVRMCQVNATATGGGMAELLARQLPISQALGPRPTGGSFTATRSSSP